MPIIHINIRSETINPLSLFRFRIKLEMIEPLSPIPTGHISQPSLDGSLP